MRRTSPTSQWMLVIAVLFLNVVDSHLFAQSQAPRPPDVVSGAQYRAVLNRYCVTCHNERLQTAGLLLDRLDLARVRVDVETWEKVLRKLSTGAMPPAGMPRPDAVTVHSLASFLERELDQASLAKPNAGRPAVHRLNRAEYANAVRELLAVEVDVDSLLPADDAGHGFDNVAEALSVSPLLVERYVSAAGKISNLAIGDLSARPAIAKYDVSRLLMQDDRASEDLPFGSRGGTAIRHDFPLDAEYVVKVRLQRNNDNYIRGLEEPHRLDVRLDGRRIKLFEVGGQHKGRSGAIFTFATPEFWGDPEQEKYELTADDGLEVRFPATAGMHTIGVSFLSETLEQETIQTPRLVYEEMMPYRAGDPWVDSVIVGGPFDAKGLRDTDSRRKIFVCHPTRKSDEDVCARRILTGLARRAYRRPVSAKDVEPLLSLYETVKEDGGFEAGITAALRGVLVSTEFLFRIERDPPNAKPGTPYRVSDLELASRLSFFLWSSIPDEQLLTAATQSKLKDRQVLDQQVRRMLADSRSKALVTNFTEQWLGLRRLKGLSPDLRLYPDFDDNLRESLQQETDLFLGSMLSEDHSLLDLLSANYTFLNERLARHYGIPNIYGSNFRRVTLSDESRAGLLGKGGILTVTSYSNRTSPTLRGKWVLENIMGTPPPPPPPDVPSLKEESEKGGKVLTMRQRMEQHRANPSCSVCHARMDPLGFALENFDAMGRWRANEGTSPVDASGVLPDGTKFRGAAELKKILLGHPEEFATTVTEKLLTYALGRGIEYYDDPTVREIVRAAAPDYRWSSLLLGIVNSAPFEMRMAAERTASAGLHKP